MTYGRSAVPFGAINSLSRAQPNATQENQSRVGIGAVNTTHAVPLSHTQLVANPPPSNYVVSALVHQNGYLEGPVMFGFINDLNAQHQPLSAPRTDPRSQVKGLIEHSASEIKNLDLNSLYYHFTQDKTHVFHLDAEQMLAFINNVRAQKRQYEQARQYLPAKLDELQYFIKHTIGQNLALSVQSLLDQYTDTQNLSDSHLLKGIRAIRRVMRAVRAVSFEAKEIEPHRLSFSQIALLGFHDFENIHIEDIAKLNHTQAMALALVMKEHARVLVREKDNLSTKSKAKILSHFESALLAIRERVNAELAFIDNPEIQLYVMHASKFISDADTTYFGAPQYLVAPLLNLQQNPPSLPAHAFIQQASFESVTAADIAAIDLDEVLALSQDEQLAWFLSNDFAAIKGCTDSQKIYHWIEALRYLHHMSNSPKLQIAIEQQAAFLQGKWLPKMLKLNANFAKLEPKFDYLLNSIKKLGFARQQIGDYGLISLSELSHHQIARLNTNQLINVDLSSFHQLHADKAEALSIALWSKIEQRKAELDKPYSKGFQLYKRLCWLYQQWVLAYPSALVDKEREVAEHLFSLQKRSNALLMSITPLYSPTFQRQYQPQFSAPEQAKIIPKAPSSLSSAQAIIPDFAALPLHPNPKSQVVEPTKPASSQGESIAQPSTSLGKEQVVRQYFDNASLSMLVAAGTPDRLITNAKNLQSEDAIASVESFLSRGILMLSAYKYSADTFSIIKQIDSVIKELGVILTAQADAGRPSGISANRLNALAQLRLGNLLLLETIKINEQLINPVEPSRPVQESSLMRLIYLCEEYCKGSRIASKLDDTLVARVDKLVGLIVQDCITGQNSFKVEEDWRAGKLIPLLRKLDPRVDSPKRLGVAGGIFLRSEEPAFVPSIIPEPREPKAAKQSSSFFSRINPFKSRKDSQKKKLIEKPKTMDAPEMPRPKGGLQLPQFKKARGSNIAASLSAKSRKVIDNQFGSGSAKTMYDSMPLSQFIVKLKPLDDIWRHDNLAKKPLSNLYQFAPSNPNLQVEAMDTIKKIQKEIWYFDYEERRHLTNILSAFKQMSTENWPQSGLAMPWLNDFKQELNKTSDMLREGSNIVDAAKLGSDLYLNMKKHDGRSIDLVDRLYSDNIRNDYYRPILERFVKLIRVLLQDELDGLNLSFQEHLSQIPMLLFTIRDKVSEFNPDEKRLMLEFLELLNSKAISSEQYKQTPFALWFANLEASLIKTRNTLL